MNKGKLVINFPNLELKTKNIYQVQSASIDITDHIRKNASSETFSW